MSENKYYKVVQGNDGNPTVVTTDRSEPTFIEPASTGERVRIEVAPGVAVNLGQRNIDAAAPYVNNKRSGEIEREKNEISKMISTSKRVVDCLIKKNIVDEVDRDYAEDLLVKATQREQDARVQFINVTGHEPKDAAKRAVLNKSRHPEWEIEPVDVSGVFDDVKPLIEHHADAVTDVMYVKKHIDDENLPNVIRFAVPNVDLPVVQDSDLSYSFTKYVHLDSMPFELKRVINDYLALRRGSFSHKKSFSFMKESARKLLQRCEELEKQQPTEEQPKPSQG